MSGVLHPKGVIALVTIVFLLGWIGFLPPAAAAHESFVAYSAATNTFTVSPSGVDDTANIQAAFDGCAATTSGCTVQLGTGTFHTAQIIADDFHGTFAGMGQAKTTIEALPDLAFGEFVTKPASAENPWPILFTFIDGGYVIRDLTFVDPWATPLQEWEACVGCGTTTALFAMISVTGLQVDAVVDHITMVGAAGDWNPLGGALAYNMINGIFPQALILAEGQTDFSGVTPIQVDFRLTNSQFYMIDNPSGGENLVHSTYVAEHNTLDTVEFGIWFTNVGDSVIEVSHNVLRNVVYGTGVIAYQNRPINVLMPCPSHSDIYITHNDIQYTGMANGVILVDYGDIFGCEKSLDGVVSSNVFHADDTSWEAVFLYLIESVVVYGNEILGPASSGIFIYLGAAMVTGNEILGTQQGVFLFGAEGAVVQHNEIADSWYFGVLMLSSDNNQVVQNEIMNSGFLDIAWDMVGTGNTWLKNECQTSDPAGLCTAG